MVALTKKLRNQLYFSWVEWKSCCRWPAALLAVVRAAISTSSASTCRLFSTLSDLFLFRVERLVVKAWPLDFIKILGYLPYLCCINSLSTDVASIADSWGRSGDRWLESGAVAFWMAEPTGAEASSGSIKFDISTDLCVETGWVVPAPSSDDKS